MKKIRDLRLQQLLDYMLEVDLDEYQNCANCKYLYPLFFYISLKSGRIIQICQKCQINHSDYTKRRQIINYSNLDKNTVISENVIIKKEKKLCPGCLKIKDHSNYYHLSSRIRYRCADCSTNMFLKKSRYLKVIPYSYLMSDHKENKNSQFYINLDMPYEDYLELCKQVKLLKRKFKERKKEDRAKQIVRGKEIGYNHYKTFDDLEQELQDLVIYNVHKLTPLKVIVKHIKPKYPFFNYKKICKWYHEESIPKYNSEVHKVTEIFPGRRMKFTMLKKK